MLGLQTNRVAITVVLSSPLKIDIPDFVGVYNNLPITSRKRASDLSSSLSPSNSSPALKRSKQERVREAVEGEGASELEMISGGTDGIRTSWEKGTELAPLLVDALEQLGYTKAATVLSEESGCVSARAEVREMKEHIENGSWEEALDSLEKLEICDEKVKKEVAFDIREEEFLESLRGYLWSTQAPDGGRVDGAEDAVRALQSMADLAEGEDELMLSARLHDNANRLLYESYEEFDEHFGQVFKEGKKWSYQHCREKLWEKIRAQLPAEMCVPPGRLLMLLEYAQKYQIDRCIYHELSYGNRGGSSLLQDHHCPPPKVTLAPTEIIHKHSDEVWYVAVSNNGKVLATCGKDKSIIIWSLTNMETAKKHGECLRYVDTLVGHDDECSVCSFNCDDSYLASGGNDGTVKVWEINCERFGMRGRSPSGRCCCTIEAHSEVITQVVWRPGFRTQVVSGGHDKTVVISDVEKNRILFTVRLRGRVHDICFAPPLDGSLWIASGRQLAAITGLGGDSPRSSAGPGSGFTVLYRIERLVSETSLITCMTVSKYEPELVLFALDSKPAMIRLWNVRERRPLGRYFGHTRGRFNLKCAFGGEEDSLVLSGSDDARIFIWHRESCSLLHVVSGGHSSTVNAVVWLSGLQGGRESEKEKIPCLVSVSDDSTIVVWTGVEEAVKIRSAAPKEETTDDILMSLIRDHSDEGSISPRFGEEEGFAEML